MNRRLIMYRRKKERNDAMQRLWEKGNTLQTIGETFGVSRQRVYQILQEIAKNKQVAESAKTAEEVTDRP